MKKAILVLIISMMLSCAGSKTLIILQHPETKDIIQCKGDAMSTWNVYKATEECAKAYEKAGYKRIGGY